MNAASPVTLFVPTALPLASDGPMFPSYSAAVALPEDGRNRGVRIGNCLRTQTDIAFVHAFVYLQFLDLLTTLVGFQVGAAEASPFIRLLMHAGPMTGVVLAKVIALMIGATCLYSNRIHAIRKLAYFSAALVIWNLVMIALAMGLI